MEIQHRYKGNDQAISSARLLMSLLWNITEQTQRKLRFFQSRNEFFPPSLKDTATESLQSTHPWPGTQSQRHQVRPDGLAQDTTCLHCADIYRGTAIEISALTVTDFCLSQIKKKKSLAHSFVCIKQRRSDFLYFSPANKTN